jgi:DNA-binding FadR family transcriptional regulator
MVEVVDARMALEAMGVRRAVELWTPEDSEAMTVNIRAQSKARSLAELSRLDVEMHEYIMRRSENELLVSLWLCIKPRFEMWLAHTHRLQARLKFEPRDVTVSAHEKLLRIIESGDREKAAAEMSAHIESWREWIPTNVL